MPTDYSHSNIEPIMLCHPSSLVADDKVLVNFYHSDQSYHLYDDNDNDDIDQEAAIVPQNLAPEQYRYEFPSKARLRQLAYLDSNNDNAYSFFDESSFATLTTMNTSYSISGNEASSTDGSEHNMYNFSSHENSAFSSCSWITDPVTDLAGDDQLDKFIESITSSYADTRMDTQSGHMPQRGTYSNHHKEPPSRFERHDFDDDEYQDEVMQLVDDSGLSPLQLPARANPAAAVKGNNSNPRSRKMSCDSTATIIRPGRRTPLDAAADPVGPSSFLRSCSQKRHEHVGVTGNGVDHQLVRPTVTHGKRKACHQDTPRRNVMHSAQTETLVDDEWELPVFYSESEPIGDDVCSFDSDNDSSCASRVVFIKLNRSRYSSSVLSQRQRCATSFTYITSDEGYEEEEEDLEGELPIESASVFLPLSEKEQECIVERKELRDAAATKIQAAWRGYKLRKERASSGNLGPSRRLLFDLAHLYSKSQSRTMQKMEQRISQLEQRLREETAMRTAFEKAMEDMTVLIDQQQKVLYNRIEQEVSMRRTYERRMDQALSIIHPLKDRLQHEIKARTELEKIVSGVVAQLQDMQQAQKAASRKEEEYKIALQRKLDDALQEIESLKRNKNPGSQSTGAKSTSSSNKVRASTAAAHPSSARTKPRILGKSSAATNPKDPQPPPKSSTLLRQSSSRLSKSVTPLSSNNLPPVRRTIVPTSQATRPASRMSTTARRIPS